MTAANIVCGQFLRQEVLVYMISVIMVEMCFSSFYFLFGIASWGLNECLYWDAVHSGYDESELTCCT